jgi:signal transduction histidine kinase
MDLPSFRSLWLQRIQTYNNSAKEFYKVKLHLKHMLLVRHCRLLMPFAFTLMILSVVLDCGYSQSSINQEKGIYFHRQYSSSEYGGHTQSWSVTEDERGLIYVGNGNGLLEYDGVEWRMIEVAGGQVALSLALGRNNQIYVGSVNDFGAIRPDSLARPVFRSMTDRVPEELLDFEDVWETKAYSGGVLFRTRTAVFHVSYDDSLTIIRPEERFERIHKINDDVYIVDLGTGLMKFEDMQFKPVPDGDQFENLSIWYMGKQPDGNIFIATREGTFLFDGQTIEPIETEIAQILTDQNVYHATEIEGKGFAFSTIRGGVFMTDYDGNVTDIIDSKILTTDQTTYVYSDRFNNLWVATTNGLNRVEISNPLTYFNESTGLTTSITDIVKHDGKIFVASPSEVQYLVNSQDRLQHSEFITISTPLVGFNLLKSTGYGLLGATYNGLVEISENGASPVMPEFEGIIVSQSVFNPETVLLGHRDGVAMFEYLNGKWNFLSTIDGVSEQVYTLEQGADGVIWAGTDFQGLIRIVLGDSIQIDRFDTEEHFNAGSARVYQVDDEVVISTETGIYKPTEPWNKEQPFTPDVSTLLSEDPSPTGTLNIEKGTDGGYWVVTDATVGFTPTLENPLVHLNEGALARVSSDDVKTILPDENGILWVANEFGLIRYDSNSDYPGDISFDAHVRGAFQNDQPIFGGINHPSMQMTELSYQQNDIRFLFGTNFIEDEDRTRFQVRLADLDDDWSNWSREAFKDYTNIPHGIYNLEVRAMNTYGTISTIGTYTFRILPPWWHSWWAYILYALMFIGGVFVIDRYQRQRLIKKERERAREKELEQAKEIEKAYEDLKAAKDQLVQQEKLASLGQLTAGIAHEIKNPLNFVNNFSELSVELVEEIRHEIRDMSIEKKESPFEGGSERSEQGDDSGLKSKINSSSSNSPLPSEASAEDGEKETPLSRGESESRKPSGEARGVSDGTKDVYQTQNSDEDSSSANTPLNPLSRAEAGSSPQMDLLLDILDDIEANLKTIHKHGTRADSIVKSMLQHSRGGDGKMEATLLNPIIKEYVNLAFHGMRAGSDPINVDIDLQLDEEVCEVPLIAEDFSRVILNLVNNGFDAMREKTLQGFQTLGGLEDYQPKLTVRTKSNSNTITIEIEDNGPGIPEEIKDKILQPFFTTKKGTAGTGLGLSITNDIVKAHGGVISIDSENEAGSKLTIQLKKR